MGDFQPAAATGLSLVGMLVSFLCILPFTQHCALSLVFLPLHDSALADPRALPLQPVLVLPTSAMFSPRRCRGEDCGRAINFAPVPCQTKLPLLFLQQSPSNDGFHSCREQRRPG
ncbi:hypothetical protein CesoFtcFv8_004520 [Champsocephalus esox]|nr:hypothetical protein CesoFtcFv8_004520 [Champsocephalus esox]